MLQLSRDRATEEHHGRRAAGLSRRLRQRHVTTLLIRRRRGIPMDTDFYSITAAGRRQLAHETENWERFSGLVGRVLKLRSGAA